MKITTVRANNRKKAFEIATARSEYSFPYAKLRRPPSSADQVAEVYADPEIGLEGFTYRLESGVEDTIHLDAVLDYNEDPDYLAEMLVYRLTVEACAAVEESGLSKRELIRRLETSPSQFYRLLDTSYTGKSIGQLLALLHIVGREVEIVARGPRAPNA